MYSAFAKSQAYSQNIEISEFSAMEKIQQLVQVKTTDAILITNTFSLKMPAFVRSFLVQDGKNMHLFFSRNSLGIFVLDQYKHDSGIVRQQGFLPTKPTHCEYEREESTLTGKQYIFFSKIPKEFIKKNLFSFLTSKYTRAYLFLKDDTPRATAKRNYYPFESITQEIMKKYVK